MTAVAEPQDVTDEALLSATPIPRAKMELIWLDPQKLKQLATVVQEGGGKAVTNYKTPQMEIGTSTRFPR